MVSAAFVGCDLYQGMALAVPKRFPSRLGFSPCLQRLKPFILARSHGTTGSRALIQIWSAATEAAAYESKHSLNADG